jgi:hypothetical protein
MTEPAQTPVELTVDYMISLKYHINFEHNLDDSSSSIVPFIKYLYYFLKNQNKSNDEIRAAIILLYDNDDPSLKENALYVFDRLTSTNSGASTLTHTLFDYIQPNMYNVLNNYNNELDDVFDSYSGEVIHPNQAFTLFNTNLNNLSQLLSTYTNTIIRNAGSTGTNISENNLDSTDSDTPETTETNSGTGGTGGTESTVSTSTSTYSTMLISHDINIPITLSRTLIYRPFLSALLSRGTNTQTYRLGEDVKNVATEDILEKNTNIIKYSELSSTDICCSICLEGYEESSTIRQLKCSHLFHKDCIDPWLLKESYKCPVCRNDTLPHTHT